MTSGITRTRGAATVTTLAERYAGCLVGLACGDALGGPVEFESREEIAAAYPGGLRDLVGGGWLDLAPGEVTDDTQMALALARALTPEPVGLDMDRLVAEFLAWYRSAPKDIGNTVGASLRLLDEGVPWEEAGLRVHRAAGERGAAGNGSVMRCAPVALRFRRDRAGLVRASIDSARVTHADPRSTWAAVAVNQATVHLLGGGAREGVAEAAVAGVAEPSVVAAVRGAADREAAAVPSGGYVLDTVGAAFWALLRHDGFEESVVAAVALGGDADTTGAVTGALAGAAYGLGAIPQRWRDGLQPRAELKAIAERLLAWSEREGGSLAGDEPTEP